MLIDIFNLEENKVSVDLNQYSTIITSEAPGDGKSYTMNKILREIAPEGKKPLFLFFEDRYQAIPNIMAIRIRNMADLKTVMQQLELPQAKDKFSCVVIDTVDSFDLMVEEYVTKKFKVGTLDEVGGYGKGTKEIRAVLRYINEIKNMGYIVHYMAQTDRITDMTSNAVSYEIKLNKNTLKAISQTAFLTGMLIKEGEDPNAKRFLTFNKCGRYPSLKNSFALPNKIPVEEYSKTLEKAIKEMGAENITNNTTVIEGEKEDFKTIIQKGMDLGGKLFEAGMIEQVNSIVSANVGVNDDGSIKRFDSLVESQKDIAKIVVIELENLAKKSNLI